MTAPATRAPIAAIVDELAARPEEEQLALLPVPRTLLDGSADRVRRSVTEHRRGRPEGARNLATRQMLDFVRRVLGDPLLERARMAMHTPDSLALALGCTKLEAAQHLDNIRADLMRLFYAPLAPVDGDGNAVVPSFSMTIGGGQAAPGAAPGGDRPPWEYLEALAQKAKEIHAVSVPQDPVSHAGVSHAEPK